MILFLIWIKDRINPFFFNGLSSAFLYLVFALIRFDQSAFGWPKLPSKMVLLEREIYMYRNTKYFLALFLNLVQGENGTFFKYIHIVKMDNDVHTTKSRTRVILFSRSIGAFLGLKNWWISALTIHRFHASLVPQ
jgi:hypothetical protein